MTQVVRTQKAEAIAHFQYEGRLIQDVPFGNGHINDTYLLTFEVKRMGILKVILQKMNKNVFKNPVELMENILGVTSYLREKIIKRRESRQRNVECNSGTGWKTILSGFVWRLLEILYFYYRCEQL